jgi:hypothetical protein
MKDIPMHNPNIAPHVANARKLSHHGIRKFTRDAVNNATVYVTELLIRNISVIIPEMILPNMFVIPTIEINVAACELGSPLEMPRSGMYVNGTDCTEITYKTCENLRIIMSSLYFIFI